MNKASLLLTGGSLAFLWALGWKAASSPSQQGKPTLGAEIGSLPNVTGPRTPSTGDGAEIPRTVPVSLTASDGTGLTLTSMVARAEVDDPLAFTELKLTFQNPQARQLEGTFRVTLPQGASVSRFAMKIDGRWQEGEVVEKQAARVAYEDFLHRKQDPALLEQAGGNEFSARVFPIPPRGSKEIIISYSQALTDGAAYALPLKGLPKVAMLDVAVNEAGSSRPVQTLRERNFLPDSDFVMDAKVEKRNAGLRARSMVMAKVRAPAGETASDPVTGAVILVDTSASRALGFASQIELVGRVVRQLAQKSPEAAFRVAAFDQVVVPIFEGKAKDFGDREIAALKKRVPLGASNLQRALAWAGDEAKKASVGRVIVVGDGVATAGATEGAAFEATLTKMKEDGVARVDTIGVGGIQDAGTMRRLVSGVFKRSGMVIDGALGATNATRRLQSATLAEVPIEVANARWSWPKRMESVQPGDEVLVYAEMPEGEAFRVSVGGRAPADVALKGAEPPLLERAFVQAKIASLSDEQARDPKPERKKEILDLSINHRVLSQYTALLVLETEQDYARFKIDRKSLKDVLSMDTGSLTVKRRLWPFSEEARLAAREELAKESPSDKSARAKGEEGATNRPFASRAEAESAPAAAASAAPPPPAAIAAPSPRPASPPAEIDQREAPLARAAGPRQPSLGTDDPMSARGNMWGDAVGDAFGSGGLGLSGVGEGGGGRGEGIGLGDIGTLGHGAGTGTGQGFGSGQGRLGGSHATATPLLRQGVTQVSGRLPPEVIQRIVRQNFGRFRLCYENGLRTNPALEGRVAVRFQIGRDGSVIQTADGGSDLPDASVVACVVRGFQNLSFPQPEDGTVSVTYPINFSPTGGSSSGAVAANQRNWTEQRVDPYTGKFKTVMTSLRADKKADALDAALTWHSEEPGDVLALVALGEAYEANNAPVEAARAYGSLIDLFSARADLRRFAGERLERIAEGAGLDLAVDTYEKAALQRADHPSSHRLLAFARLRKGDHAGAFDAALNGARRRYPEGRFAGVTRILREDLGLIGAAWLKQDPTKRDEVQKQLREAGATLETGPSLRFVLNWETDANDVDFHIYDAKGGHAFYSQRNLDSGGELYADVTTGYGPECFTIRKAKGQRAGPYKLQAHYYSRGPMGYGMGKLEVIDHDGKGGLTFEERPYVVMVDRAFVELGTVKN